MKERNEEKKKDYISDRDMLLPTGRNEQEFPSLTPVDGNAPRHQEQQEFGFPIRGNMGLDGFP
jgi:hypothetical protein